MSFQTILAQRRKAQGFRSQDALAEASGVSKRSIADYERGKAEPTLALMVKLAQALDCTLDDLAGQPHRALEVVVDGVRYVPESPHHDLSGAGSSPGDRPSATPDSDEPAAVPDQTPRSPTRRARRKPREPAPDG